MDTSIVITGVSGFLGRYIARYLSSQGFDVYGVDSSPSENAPTSYLRKYFSLRLPDNEFNALVKQVSPSVLIHCAGRASVGLSVEKPSSDFYSNTLLTFDVLDSLRLNSPSCKFILLSSAAVYGNPSQLPVNEAELRFPISPYGYHKHLCEELCLEFANVYGMSTASSRIFSAYGPGLRRQVLWDICRKALTEPSISLLGTGQESRDFIHAIDVAKALFALIKSAPMNGEAYNLASGREVTIKQLSELVTENLGVEKEVRFDGIIPVGNPLNWRADISRIKALGFVPSVSLERGVKTFLNWCQAELIGC